jgi:hypothetical protein
VVGRHAQTMEVVLQVVHGGAPGAGLAGRERWGGGRRVQGRKKQGIDDVRSVNHAARHHAGLARLEPASSHGRCHDGRAPAGSAPTEQLGPASAEALTGALREAQACSLARCSTCGRLPFSRCSLGGAFLRCPLLGKAAGAQLPKAVRRLAWGGRALIGPPPGSPRFCGHV